MKQLAVVAVFLAVSQLVAGQLPFYRLGAAIGSSHDDSSHVEKLSSKEYKDRNDTKHQVSLFRSNTVVASPHRKNRVTKISYQTGPGFVADVSSGGCIETRFLTFEELGNTPISNNSIVILNEEADAKKFELLKTSLADKSLVTLGFLKRFDDLTADLRNILYGLNVAFIENLDLPHDFDISSTQSYRAFLFVFMPFANGTSTSPADGPKVRVNLVDLTLFASDKVMNDYCATKKDEIVLLSHKFPQASNNPGAPKVHQIGTMTFLNFSTEIGTHVVSPQKWNSAKHTISELSPSHFFAPCVRLEMRDDPKVGLKVTEELIKKSTVDIPENSIVFIDTNYARFWNDVKTYKSPGPIIDPTALTYLIEDRKVATVGTDLISFDHSRTDASNQHYLADYDIPSLHSVYVNETTFPANVTNATCLISYLPINTHAVPAGVFLLPDFPRRLHEKPEITEVLESKEDADKTTSTGNSAPILAIPAWAIVLACFNCLFLFAF